ncbi:hypothetical protein Tco_0173344 [Tanacetum coccineum]
MEPDIENMMLDEYREYETEKERRLWDNYLEEDQEDDGDDRDTFDMTFTPLIPTTLHTTPPNEFYVAPATKPILDKLLEENILNVVMVDEEANPTRDLEEPERLLVEDPHFMEIQGSNSMRMEFKDAIQSSKKESQTGLVGCYASDDEL